MNIYIKKKPQPKHNHYHIKHLSLKLGLLNSDFILFQGFVFALSII